MKNPKPEKIREMCDMMERAHAKYGVKINMAVVSIEKEPCGTLCCHAGLFSLARAMDKDGWIMWPYKWKSLGKNFEDGRDTARLMFEGQKNSDFYERVPYVAGECAMNQFLGYEKDDKDDLTTWADENPELWGNEYGGQMFSWDGAFDMDDNGTTVEVILKHWRKVADRIEEANNEKS